MIYLASPYSANPAVNYAYMLEVGQRLMRRCPPPTFFSPVLHFHPIGQGVPYEQIMDVCLDILNHCNQLAVVMLPGWEESKGVQREIEHWAPMSYLLLHPVTLAGVDKTNPVNGVSIVQ